MAQKRKANYTKKTGRAGSNKLDEAAALLKKIEAQTARRVRRNLGDNWRDNLFEIMMTRVELATPHKKFFAALPRAFRDDPKELPRFARLFWGTMKRLLQLAEAPARPLHIAAFGALYVSVVDTFLKDDTRDHAKTMAVLDKRLGLFEQFTQFDPCPSAPCQSGPYK